MNKLIIVGPINLGNVPATGDTMKNQLFLKRFSEVFDKVIPIDTSNWKHRPWVLVQLLLTIVFNRDTKIVISANPGSADNIIRYLKKMHLGDNLYYWVVGGSFHNSVKKGFLKVETYKNVKAILVQGESMAESLNEQGLKNAVHVPNSKYIDFIPKKNAKKHSTIRFVFLSRIEEYKGCSDIISSIDILNKKGYKGRYDVTFYGKTIDKLDYVERFNREVSEHPEASYKGLLNLRDSKNYDELASYDVMLFPTYWSGEGFPGVIIDAYIAGLPVIASDWNLNRDVVEDGKTGWIIPVHDVNALADKMAYAIDHPEIVKEYSENSSVKAMDYDSRNVLSVDNLKRIGLL